MTPIDSMLETVAWQATNAQPSGGLYATHSGVLEIESIGLRMRCYRLNDGQTVFDADDFQRFFADIFEPPQPEEPT